MKQKLHDAQKKNLIFSSRFHLIDSLIASFISQRDGTKVWRINTTSIFNENFAIRFVEAKKSFQ